MTFNKTLLTVVFTLVIASVSAEPFENAEDLQQVSSKNHQNITPISLSDEEQRWLREHSPIVVGVHQSWKPIEFINNNNELVGINPSVLSLIEQSVDIQFAYRYYSNWGEIYNALVNKEIDLLGTVTPTEERAKSLIFTDSYWELPWVVLHPKSTSNRLDLKSFYGKKLAVIKGYYLVNRLREEHPNIALQIVDDNEQGLLAVQQGLVDGLVENIASASQLLDRESIVSMGMSVVDDFNVDENTFAMTKEKTVLRSILNKAIANISEAQKDKIYQQWFEIKIQTGVSKEVIVRVAVQVSVIVILVFAIVIYWNRRLHIEINRRKELELKMKHMATHDELTGLANRILLKDRINSAINLHNRQELEMAVLFIDLDGFKSINDTHGHDVGDELLVQVAERLRDCVRKSDTIVRFGGDEFILLLTAIHNRSEAAYVAEKVLKLMQKPFQLSATQAFIGCSIGIAMYPDDGDSDVELLKIADNLMYKVKAAGKNHYAFNSH